MRFVHHISLFVSLALAQSNSSSAVYPPTGAPKVPDDYTLVQIGLFYPLSWSSVVKNETTIAKLFDLIPQGIAYALRIDKRQVLISQLKPYSLAKNSDTLALLYVPDSLTENLGGQLNIGTSLLYSNPDRDVMEIMGYVDPYIALFP